MRFGNRDFQISLETDNDIARVSMLKDNNHIFASKYKLYLPTKEQLQREIERQKELFRLQHNDEV